jgi:hypothetical protein
MDDPGLVVIEPDQQVFRPSPQPGDLPPGQAFGEAFGQRPAQIGAALDDLGQVAPARTGSSPRRTVSTSGSSGMGTTSAGAKSAIA